MKQVVLMASLLMGGAAFAGTGSGTVTSLIPAVSNGTQVFVLTLAAMQGQPSCATAARFALSGSDPRYQTLLNALLQAYFQHGVVYARGLGTCDTNAGSEDLAYVCFNNGTPC